MWLVELGQSLHGWAVHWGMASGLAGRLPLQAGTGLTAFSSTKVGSEKRCAPGYCIWSGRLALLAGSVWLVAGSPPAAVREPEVEAPIRGSSDGEGAAAARQMSLM